LLSEPLLFEPLPSLFFPPDELEAPSEEEELVPLEPSEALSVLPVPSAELLSERELALFDVPPRLSFT